MKADVCGAQAEARKSDCRADNGIPTIQPFPKGGTLARNLELPLRILKTKILHDSGNCYSYILRSVKFDDEIIKFEQYGSAPNVQGGVLTLCTCKHQMRATRSAGNWKGVWLAGFTSRTIHDGRHWLFYLAKIDSAYESHADLWKAMTVRARKAKAADANFLGDMFRPKSPPPTGQARFSPRRYVTPSAHTHRRHRRDRSWHNDINYLHADKYGQPALLVADPRQTFLWDEPLICFAGDHCRNFRKWSSLSDLVSKLREAR